MQVMHSHARNIKVAGGSRRWHRTVLVLIIAICAVRTHLVPPVIAQAADKSPDPEVAVLNSLLEAFFPAAAPPELAQLCLQLSGAEARRLWLAQRFDNAVRADAFEWQASLEKSRVEADEALDQRVAEWAVALDSAWTDVDPAARSAVVEALRAQRASLGRDLGARPIKVLLTWASPTPWTLLDAGTSEPVVTNEIESDLAIKVTLRYSIVATVGESAAAWDRATPRESLLVQALDEAGNPINVEAQAFEGPLVDADSVWSCTFIISGRPELENRSLVVRWSLPADVRGWRVLDSTLKEQALLTLPFRWIAPKETPITDPNQNGNQSPVTQKPVDANGDGRLDQPELLDGLRRAAERRGATLADVAEISDAERMRLWGQGVPWELLASNARKPPEAKAWDRVVRVANATKVKNVLDERSHLGGTSFSGSEVAAFGQQYCDWRLGLRPNPPAVSAASAAAPRLTLILQGVLPQISALQEAIRGVVPAADGKLAGDLPSPNRSAQSPLFPARTDEPQFDRSGGVATLNSIQAVKGARVLPSGTVPALATEAVRGVGGENLFRLPGNMVMNGNSVGFSTVLELIRVQQAWFCLTLRERQAEGGGSGFQVELRSISSPADALTGVNMKQALLICLDTQMSASQMDGLLSSVKGNTQIQVTTCLSAGNNESRIAGDDATMLFLYKVCPEAFEDATTRNVRYKGVRLKVWLPARS